MSNYTSRCNRQIIFNDTLEALAQKRHVRHGYGQSGSEILDPLSKLK